MKLVILFEGGEKMEIPIGDPSKLRINTYNNKISDISYNDGRRFIAYINYSKVICVTVMS